MKVETWPIHKPLPYAHNPRQNREAVEKVAASLKEFGWQQPIVVDKDGVVVVGHTRLAAAKRLGMTEVPVVVAHDLSPAKARAYRITDNRVGETATWNVDLLAQELGGLKEEFDFDLDLTGFEDFELAALIPEDDFATPSLYQTETVKLNDLKEHPRNYVKHPEDQLAHIIQSIKQHGIYRNVIIAKENTILSGHGLVSACRKMGRKAIPVVRLNISPESAQALKILVGDNDMRERGRADDRLKAALLQAIDKADSLLGTGYDDTMLKDLLFMTSAGVKDKAEVDHAEEWSGMPEYVSEDNLGVQKISVHFRTEEDVQAFAKLVGQPLTSKTKSIWYPAMAKREQSCYKYVTAEGEEEDVE